MERPTCSHAPQATCPLQAQAQEHAGAPAPPKGDAPRRVPAALSPPLLARVSRTFLIMTGLRLSLWLYDHAGAPPSLAYDAVALGFFPLMIFAIGLLCIDIRRSRTARKAAAARPEAGR